MDYVSIFGGIFQFAAGSMNGDQVCVNVTILDDIIFEKAETFALLLSTAEVNVLVGPDSTVVIKDDEGRY